MLPKISIIIPFHNEEKYIKECIQSVLKQTFNDFELIMVNDGSTDGSSEIVKKYAEDDNRIKLIDLNRSGLVAALNKGIKTARGEFIARMDADDIMHEERLKLQYEYMTAHPDVSVLSSLVEKFPQKIVSPNMQLYIDWLNSLTDNNSIKRDIFIESPVAHPSVMLRRSEVIKLGGYTDNGMPEDYDLWLRYYAAGKNFHKINKVLHYWRERHDRYSRVSDVYSQDNFVKLKSKYLADLVLTKKKFIYIWGAGRDGKSLCKNLKDRGLDIRGFIDIDKKKISQIICGYRVIGYTNVKELSGFIVVCVGSKGARSLIRRNLNDLGYAEGKNYICVA